MAEISVEINGRKFRMACADGEEAHLSALAAKFDERITGYKDAFGEIGDNRLTVMAGIGVLDELAETERKLAALNKEVADLKEVERQRQEEVAALEADFARKLSETARQVESIATAIDGVNQNENPGN